MGDWTVRNGWLVESRYDGIRRAHRLSSIRTVGLRSDINSLEVFFTDGNKDQIHISRIRGTLEELAEEIITGGHDPLDLDEVERQLKDALRRLHGID